MQTWQWSPIRGCPARQQRQARRLRVGRGRAYRRAVQQPEQGLRVLGAALQAAANVAAPWPAAISAGPIIWDNLLKAPGRRHAMFDEFRVSRHHRQGHVSENCHLYKRPLARAL